MSDPKIEKARTAAQKAAEDLAALEAVEAEKAAEKAAQAAAKEAVAQRANDEDFLSKWEAFDTELMGGDSRSAARIVYEGGDVVQALADFWVRRAKRQVLREHARAAYRRFYGEEPPASFAHELRDYDTHSDKPGDFAMKIDLAAVIRDAAVMHAADFADDLDAKREAYVNGAN
ncbi:hypothetical protein ACWD62_04315 [Streptomyces sp. NPDC005146]